MVLLNNSRWIILVRTDTEACVRFYNKTDYLFLSVYFYFILTIFDKVIFYHISEYNIILYGVIIIVIDNKGFFFYQPPFVILWSHTYVIDEHFYWILHWNLVLRLSWKIMWYISNLLLAQGNSANFLIRKNIFSIAYWRYFSYCIKIYLYWIM